MSFVCEIDGRIFNNNNGGKYHKKLHGEKVFNCDQWHQVFSTQNDLTTHKTCDFHAGASFPCEKCEKSSTIKKSLERHVMSKHEKQKFCCAICGYEFAKNNYIQCKRKVNEKELQ